MTPKHIHAVVFDAVGTLIFPKPSAGDVYAEVGRRFGSDYPHALIKQRFAEAFAREEALDQAHGWRTDEARERDRWHRIVTQVLDDVDDPSACFNALYTHFAQPQAWRCESTTTGLLRWLHDSGRQVVVASNFDHRLRPVLAGLPELARLDRIIISAEVGWRKPAPEFFQSLCGQIALTPQQLLVVGDHPHNDFLGASQAGCHALLFDPTNKRSDFDGPRISSLADVPRLLQEIGD